MTGQQQPIPVRVGYIPLTDCAPLVMAAAKGFDRKHGIELVLSREPSWAAIRDQLLSGGLDAAHALYGLVYGVQMGIGGPRQDMAVLVHAEQPPQLPGRGAPGEPDRVVSGGGLTARPDSPASQRNACPMSAAKSRMRPVVGLMAQYQSAN